VNNAEVFSGTNAHSCVRVTLRMRLYELQQNYEMDVWVYVERKKKN